MLIIPQERTDARSIFCVTGKPIGRTGTGPDSDRPLTDNGIKEMKTIGEAIAGLKIERDSDRTSPIAAAQPDRRGGRGLAPNLPAKIKPSLEPGFDVAALGAC